MTIQKFKQLSEIYGAKISDWPPVYRDEIKSLSDQQFAEMRLILNKEAELDGLLAESIIEPPSPALLERIIASAPQPKVTIWQILSAWLNGRVITIGLSTAMVGAFCMSILTTNLLSNNLENMTNNEYRVDDGQDWIG